MNTATVNAPATENLFESHVYFKTRQGLWVADSFNNRILSKVGQTPHRGNEGVTSSILVRNMSDQEIIDELLGGMEEARKHSFTLDQIATMLDLQSNGEDGDLLNNGYANIFYILVNEVLYALYVDWKSDNLNWRVSLWHLGENSRWRACGRVFHNTTLTI